MSGAGFCTTTAFVSQGSKMDMTVSGVLAIRTGVIASPMCPAIMTREAIIARGRSLILIGVVLIGTRVATRARSVGSVGAIEPQ